MQGKKVATGLLFAIALFAAGCAVDEVTQGPPSPEEFQSPSESTSESEIIVWCSNKSWRVDFYAEPAHINLVGWLRCDCYRPQTRSGTTSNYTNLAYDFTCDLN
jgi:hypothetical protein